jgi:alkanesulfonate monooxygenase SsuD/methylene tetrahydromethanopterin reductase-like flavin-dependent oxidoreductase (luciferase family)
LVKDKAKHETLNTKHHEGGWRLQYYFFHLMSWPYLPAAFADEHDSAWVWVPNALYDPEKGRDLYRDYLDTLAYADELGFDGVCVNEHHQNAYGLMPSPNVIAGALTQRTKRCKIAVIGNALPLYNPPLRVAEEMAMLDVLSGGRLIAGMVIGSGPEYYSYQVNPTYAREKFREALDLIIKAWTTPGPFAWHSKHYYFQHVNPWPRPMQQPHPPIWVPGVGSIETIELVAQRRYCYMGIPYFHMDVFRRVFAQFRAACDKAGYTARPEQMGWGVPIYVAETDRQAREEVEPHLWYFIKNLLKGIGLAPPGYTSPRSALAIINNHKYFLYEQKTWDDIEKGVFAIVGSPATVRQKLEQYQKELGCGVVLTGCQMGSLPHELARKSMELLAREVLPYTREMPTADREKEPFQTAAASGSHNRR